MDRYPRTGGAAVSLSDVLGSKEAKTERKARSANGSHVEQTNGAHAKYVNKVLNEECRAVREAPKGTRNDTLNRSAFSLGTLVGGGYLDEHVAERELASAAADAGLGDLEIGKTISSGLAAGKNEPRQIPESSFTRKTNGTSGSGNVGSAPPPDDDYEHTDADAPGSGEAPAPAQSSALEARWIEIGRRLEFVTEAPPPQTWLLKQWQGQHDHGVFPRGKTGLLTATGGVGKTMALIQGAVAVASGGFWLDTFRPAEPGPVLLALAEEDEEEARRRIWRAINAADLTAEERAECASRLHLLALHGVPVALTWSPSHGVVATSDFAVALRDKLNNHGVDWALIILDPLSRWAGGGIEANNEAATRFVQVVETLTTVRGSPSVLVAHHSSQTMSRAGESDARGVTGIRDGFRWMASMDAIADDEGNVDGVMLRNRKSNYSLRFKPMLLVRNTEQGIEGTLRQATPAEADDLAAALPKERQSAGQRDQIRQNQKRGAFEADCAAVLALMPTAPKHITGTALETALRAAGTPKSDKTLRGILERLVEEARVVDLSNGAQSKPRQWARTEADNA
jgi:hypothetical protein